MSRSASLIEAFASATYNPLLAATPPGSVDTEILAMAPGKARTLCLVIYHETYEEGTPLSEQTWDWLGSLIGEDEDVARWALRYAVWLNHEVRHHLDVYGTALGLHYLTALAREYRLLAGTLGATRGAGPSRYFTDKLRRVRSMANYWLGRVDLDAKTLRLAYDESPIGNGASLRVRRAGPYPDAESTLISVCRGQEWALSSVGILEARALIETAAFVRGGLAAAGHGQEVQATAERLLFDGLDRSPDWYWGLFAAVGGVTNDRDLAESWWRFAPPIFNASWHALNGPPPVAMYDLVHVQPVYRFAVALARLTTLAEDSPDQWFSNDYIHRSLAPELDDPLDLSDREVEWQNLAARYMVDTSLGDGVAAAHLRTLAQMALDTLLSRAPRGAWVNSLSGYRTNNALLVGGSSLRYDLAPHLAVELLMRCRSAVRLDGMTDTDLADYARPLFSGLPENFAPDPALYGP